MSEFQNQRHDSSPDDSGSSVQPSAGVIKSPGFLGRLTLVFSAPAEAFVGLNFKWEWLAPALIVAALGMTAQRIQLPYLLPVIKASAMERVEAAKGQLPPDSYQELRESVESGIADQADLSVKNLSIGVLAALVFVVIIGLIGSMSGNFFLGGKEAFWKILTIVAFTGFIGVLGELARAGLMVMKDSSYVYVGLGLLKPVDDGSFLYYLLRQVEFTTIWRIAAMCVGLGVLYQKPTKSFAYIIFPFWLIFLALVAGANLIAGGTIMF